MSGYRTTPPDTNRLMNGIIAAIFLGAVIIALFSKGISGQTGAQNPDAMGYYGMKSVHDEKGGETTVFFTPWETREEVEQKLNHVR